MGVKRCYVRLQPLGPESVLLSPCSVRLNKVAGSNFLVPSSSPNFLSRYEHIHFHNLMLKCTYQKTGEKINILQARKNYSLTTEEKEDFREEWKSGEEEQQI